MVDGAEAVGYARLTPVANQEQVDLAELPVAVRAARGLLIERLRLGELPGLPVSSPERPGDHVLQAAEGSAP